MSVAESLWMGTELMLLGMGSVFSFLIVLVFTLKGMSAIAQRFGEDEPAQPSQATPATQVSQGINSNTDARLVAAISAAITRYRANHG